MEEKEIKKSTTKSNNTSSSKAESGSKKTKTSQNVPVKKKAAKDSKKGTTKKAAKESKSKTSKKGAKESKSTIKKKDAKERKSRASKVTSKKTKSSDMIGKNTGNGSTEIALSAASFILNTALTVVFYIIVVIAISKACNSVYDLGYQVYGNVSVESAPGHTVNIVIEDSESTMNVASKLELNGVIQNKYTFYLRTKLSGKTIFPGTYQVNSSMNYEQILDVIADYETALDNKEEENKNN